MDLAEPPRNGPCVGHRKDHARRRQDRRLSRGQCRGQHGQDKYFAERWAKHALPEWSQDVIAVFGQQVWPGDRLVASARVTQVYEADEEPRIDLDLTMTREGGGVAITGMATFATDELGDDE